MKKHFLFLFSLIYFLNLNAQTKRPLIPTDVYRLQEISDPQVSPEGTWVAYTLSSVDTAKD